ncbi:coiled-coil domain-containing protein 28A [Gasterosteus aculeatus]
MEERKLKRKSPRTSNNTDAPTGGSGRKNNASSGGRHVGSGHIAGARSSQRNKNRRGGRDKPRHHMGVGGRSALNQGQAAPIIQHSFLTDVSDVQEMENGLLSLLNDFHSGKLQAFDNECSIGQMEHVREMQERLARLHFDLYNEVDEMPEDQRKVASDTNMDKLLLNLEELSSSIQKLNLADSQEVPRTASV